VHLVGHFRKLKVDSFVAKPFPPYLTVNPGIMTKEVVRVGGKTLCFHTFLTAISKLIMHYCNCEVALEMAGLARYKGTVGTPPLQ
jgi:hypothetical protein